MYREIIVVETCLVCLEDFDIRERNLGLDEKMCRACNEKTMVITKCKQRKLCDYKHCRRCYDRSLASHHRAVYLSERNLYVKKERKYVGLNVIIVIIILIL